MEDYINRKIQAKVKDTLDEFFIQERTIGAIKSPEDKSDLLN